MGSLCCRRQPAAGAAVAGEILGPPVPSCPKLNWRGDRIALSPSGNLRTVKRTGSSDLQDFDYDAATSALQGR